ncbi:MAG: hypothetical protein ACI4XG_12500, partial [Bradyrhizobium sp.]
SLTIDGSKGASELFPAAAASRCGNSNSVGNTADPWSNWRRFKAAPLADRVAAMKPPSRR